MRRGESPIFEPGLEELLKKNLAADRLQFTTNAEGVSGTVCSSSSRWGRRRSATSSSIPLAILTEWQEFRSPDFDAIGAALASPVIFDGRSLYDPEMVKRSGLAYYAIGRGDSVAKARAGTTRWRRRKEDNV